MFRGIIWVKNLTQIIPRSITTQSNHEIRMSNARVHGKWQHKRTISTTVKVRWRTAVNDRVGQNDFTCFEIETQRLVGMGNTKITEAFVYQLCCGYRTVKSPRQPVKISTNFVFLPGYSSSASRYSSDYSAWLRIATYFLMNGGLTLLEINDCTCSLRGRLLRLFWRIRERVWIANRLCSSITYYFYIVKT